VITRLFAFLLLLLSFSGAASLAAIDDYSFDTPEQEARFHRLSAEVRCPMCLNSNLAGSDAPIAADLRAEILRQIRQGRSDREIMEFLKARYGDFITYRPPLNTGTTLLWFGPLALLLAGFVVLRRMMGVARANAADTALSPTEQQRLQQLMNDDKEPPR